MKESVKWCYTFFVLFLNVHGSPLESFIVSSTSNLKVYWNIPSFQCRSFKMNFSDLAEKYGIIQNQNGDFRGSNISILYDPGFFPAILNESGDVELRNGGIPQDGNIRTHLKLFDDTITDQIPDKKFSGLGIIDFEMWRPVFRQNFGTLSRYKAMSIEKEKRMHPFWPSVFVEKEAERRFEMYGRMFMEETLVRARKLRPNGRWGYYAYPYCFNKSPSNMNKDCPKQVQEENDRLTWLYKESDLLLPSIYLSDKMSSKDKMELIEGRVNEAHRIVGYLGSGRHNPSILPYFWYKYQDSKRFMSKVDLKNSFSLLSNLRIDGVIIWGSSNDVNTKSKCLSLYNYINDVLGPILINTT
ncbi:hypothetical protein HHI36_021407 [Cryptolaemus montrouzieri]|uniref:Hyaluronidase n=1 Tax=Cryptolaemus montrouzieri TaxID=559131 RepID=A0ABD2MX26_9CUCU